MITENWRNKKAGLTNPAFLLLYHFGSSESAMDCQLF